MDWVGVAGVLLIVIVLLDTFETMILPRRVARPYRLTRLYYRSTWVLWRALAQLIPAVRRRNGFLSMFGPLSLFGLLVLWAAGLITGFALLHWSLEQSFREGTDNSFVTHLYFSGTTFFTLGYGDLVPVSVAGRALSVVEAGLGFGFLAVVIGYLPVLHGAFSHREITISLLDARAGSPPTAGELLRRLAEAQKDEARASCRGIAPLLAEWERWAAELLESHLSFPVLSYYRSQHDNQSWVAALTAILDTSALLLTVVDGPDGYQARLTFAMARHAAVDLGLVFRTPAKPLKSDRLPADALTRLLETLREAGLPLRDGPATARALAELRALYEPFVNALAVYFRLVLPPFQPEKPPVDNWQTSPWMRRSPGLGELASGTDEHPV
jgi:hypothetical protein